MSAETPGTPSGAPTATADAPGDGGRGDARIHDIGYRGYSGERLGRSAGRRALFEHSLRGAYGLGRSARSKIMPFILFGIVCFPAVIFVAVALTVGLDELPIRYSEYPLYMAQLVALYIALAAPQMVSLDLRHHTTPLYFSRPIERVDYVLAKLGALTAALFLFTAIPLTIMWIGALLGELDFADQTRMYGQGLALAVIFAILHACIALLIASFTPRRGFGVAAVIAVLTIPYFAVVSVQWVLHDQGGTTAVTWLGLLSPGTLLDGLQAALLGGTSNYPSGTEPDTAVGLVFLLVALGVSALCVLLLSRRYRKVGI
ncbi:ABC transporter permease [Streptomyces sp. ST2-7A]|uniref:ABC transporter permease n=1 Tax=Streptomyces sp. ST2-7A TaxID=2907214 RepID=UPI001F209D74|nr:ABC transporter permease [Streptomyces sp. ST2-7A]MCE7081443.1 ABC transporter permease [Streptomyces sp. ST2-7A]